MILVFNYGLFVDRGTRNQEKGESRKVESKNRPDNISFAQSRIPEKINPSKMDCLFSRIHEFFNPH